MPEHVDKLSPFLQNKTPATFPPGQLLTMQVACVSRFLSLVFKSVAVLVTIDDPFRI